MTLGGKYTEKMQDNPAPGQYDPDSGLSMTKPKSYEAYMKEGSGFELVKEGNPDAG